jgi:ribosomal protein S18 acetylase RimI-like enzyme
MDDLDIEIKFVDEWPSDDIVELYKAGGWWKDNYDKSKIPKLIKDSFAFAVAIDKNTEKTIGMGRILSDGISDAYIQDLVILPKYRERGIGKKLVKALVNHCHKNKIYWIALIAEPDQDGFYENLGFKKMKNYVPLKYDEE